MFVGMFVGIFANENAQLQKMGSYFKVGFSFTEVNTNSITQADWVRLPKTNFKIRNRYLTLMSLGRAGIPAPLHEVKQKIQLNLLGEMCGPSQINRLDFFVWKWL